MECPDAGPESGHGLEIHLIIENYATHKHANVKAWLEKRTEVVIGTLRIDSLEQASLALA
ncbi:hypothetical protein [Specibacter sp. RAF43]|uniref:hypothetical protein n=1 Tax=Specibacter sp. RAF43 TaxID=3233057 RepID=UPI003F9A97AF